MKKGVALLLALIMVVLILVMGIAIVIITMSNIRTITSLKRGMKTFYCAEAGIWAAAAYYITTLSPQKMYSEQVLEPEGGMYKATAKILGNAGRKLIGYDPFEWAIGILINSVCPPDNPQSEIEAVIGIPHSATHGNEDVGM